jgi:hypothetical protein
MEHQDPLSAGMSTTIITQPTSIIEKQSIQYPTHPFPPPFCETISKLPLGLQELVLQGAVSIQITDLIHLVSIWISSLTITIDAVDSELKRSEYVIDTFFRPRYILRQALCIFISFPESFANRVATSIERCLCLSFMSSIHAERSPFRTTTTYIRLVSDFIDAVESLSSDILHLNKAGAECLVWLCFTSAGCAAQCLDSHVARRGSGIMDWLVDEPRMVALGIRVWERVEALLKRFFWFQHLVEIWRSCWNAGIDRVTVKNNVSQASDLP